MTEWQYRYKTVDSMLWSPWSDVTMTPLRLAGCGSPWEVEFREKPTKCESVLIGFECDFDAGHDTTHRAARSHDRGTVWWTDA